MTDGGAGGYLIILCGLGFEVLVGLGWLTEL